MTDRDKLIELIVNADTYDSYECKLCTKKDASCTHCNAEKLTDYLLANGVIVPPCKVGDVVYSSGYDWQKAKDVIVPYQITNITITQNKKCVWTKKYRAMRILNGKTIDCQLNFEFDTIGKTIFLTREEAEEELKKRGN